MYENVLKIKTTIESKFILQWFKKEEEKSTQKNLIKRTIYASREAFFGGKGVYE